MKLSKITRARAMKCFGNLAFTVELDPDPDTRAKLTEEFNCKNCDSYKYCNKLAHTLS